MLSLTLIVRLVLLQATDGGRGADFLRQQGAMRAVRTGEIPVHRGVITDRFGTPLAVSSPVISLWANPQKLKNFDDLVKLAGLLKLDVDVLRDKLGVYADKQFMYLLRHQTPEFATSVLQARVPGLAGAREYRRFYPAGEVTAQVLGLTNLDGQGIAGIEMAFDHWLRGVAGKKRFIKDLHGDVVRDFGVIQEAHPGKDLAMSVDLRLQYVQHRELQRAIKETGAEAGSAVTIDAWTGEILAISNYPVFNPNSRAIFDYENARNRALTDVFEPGSTIKTFTLVAGLESGQFLTDSIIDTSPGLIRIGTKVLNDPRDYGKLTVSEIIQKSSQVGVTKMATAIGHGPILEVLARFGFGEQTGTGFPGERTGSIPSHERASAIDKVSVAFGYGLSSTLTQLARAYGVFANQGMQLPLTLLRLDPGQKTTGEQIITEEIARDVLDVLARVTGPDGTAKLARVPGFSVGGKTGTVHKLGANGYLDNEYIAWFVGIAPMDEPRYVTAILIDQPRGDYYGGATAAPIYARITQEVLRMRNVRPDYAEEDHFLALSSGRHK